MSSIKSKPCVIEDCDYPRWAKGYCRYHQFLREDKRDATKKKKKSAIPPFSQKQLKRLETYSVARSEYLTDNPNCQVCGTEASEIHHKKGKIGELLWNKTFFLSVCRQCHTKIELNPYWAKENNFSVDRLH